MATIDQLFTPAEVNKVFDNRGVPQSQRFALMREYYAKKVIPAIQGMSPTDRAKYITAWTGARPGAPTLTGLPGVLAAAQRTGPGQVATSLFHLPVMQGQPGLTESLIGGLADVPGYIGAGAVGELGGTALAPGLGTIAGGIAGESAYGAGVEAGRERMMGEKVNPLAIGTAGVLGGAGKFTAEVAAPALRGFGARGATPWHQIAATLGAKRSISQFGRRVETPVTETVPEDRQVRPTTPTLADQADLERLMAERAGQPPATPAQAPPPAPEQLSLFGATPAAGESISSELTAVVPQAAPVHPGLANRVGETVQLLKDRHLYNHAVTLIGEGLSPDQIVQKTGLNPQHVEDLFVHTGAPSDPAARGLWNREFWTAGGAKDPAKAVERLQAAKQEAPIRPPQELAVPPVVVHPEMSRPVPTIPEPAPPSEIFPPAAAQIPAPSVLPKLPEPQAAPPSRLFNPASPSPQARFLQQRIRALAEAGNSPARIQEILGPSFAGQQGRDLITGVLRGELPFAQAR